MFVEQAVCLVCNLFCSFFSNVESSTPSYPSPNCQMSFTDDTYRRTTPDPLRVLR